jgi:hypothetical protein
MNLKFFKKSFLRTKKFPPKTAGSAESGDGFLQILDFFFRVEHFHFRDNSNKNKTF